MEQVAAEVSTTQMIKPRGRLGICVAKAHISPPKHIRIPFKIEGETDTTDSAAPEHFALFYSNE